MAATPAKMERRWAWCEGGIWAKRRSSCIWERLMGGGFGVVLGDVDEGGKKGGGGGGGVV